MNAKQTRTSKITNRQLGDFGEQVVAEFLIRNGAQIVERNWRTKGGEIDLVAITPDGIFKFVEVKTRSSTAFGDPLEAIDRHKAHRLQKLALAWLATHANLGHDFQIDCVGVLLDPKGAPQVDYRSNVL